MQKYGVNELRRMFLEFFESKEHLAMKSFSLVPHNDNSLLLINSGMAPLKPYFTGQEIPPRRRVTTCQKCIRTGDIENIGKTARHGTFFEMLGNFSFGDYFKTEAIHWAWEFLTECVGIPADRLYPSVYLDDDEAFRIWNEEIGIPKERIYRFGKEDNFWEHGAGPCGPCSEIYYDRGEKYGTGPEDVMGGEGDRFMEVWNVVFSQFNNDGHGNYTDLIQKNIDTGMGLERLAVVCQDVASLFDVDTNRALMDEVGALAHCRYEEDDKKDVSLRIIADHVKSCTFMASDGIMPSNEGRGYVFRRLLRRAARHGRILGIEGSFMTKLAQVVIDLSKDGYPELEEKKDMILRVIDQEEERFANTIDKGLEILADLEKDMEAKGTKVLAGEDAFKLYDTYGFPIDLTKEILDDKGLTVDEEGFHKAMQVQRETARSARKTTNYMGRDDIYQKLDASLTSAFTGYDKLEDESKVTALVRLAADEEGEDEIADAVTDGEKACVITSETPFYGTMGGQVGDRGVIESANGKFEVEDTIHLQGGKIGHIGHMVSGMFRTGETVTLKVNEENRSLIGRNHSATHLLHKALRTVLGTHVEQAGSLVTRDRLRFDFTHFSAMSQDEIKEVENIVNKDDVLTYLIHMGYLAYSSVNRMAFVPNEEIRQELIRATKRKEWNEMLKFQQESEDLLDATLDMDGEIVAAQIEKIHEEYVSAIQYNNENSLSSVLALAYLSAMQYYFKPVREFPTGRGFADFVFIPKTEYRNDYPALVVELKWNKSAVSALQQIKDKKYPDSIQKYAGNILLVEINYSKKEKKHECVIEEYLKK